MADDYLTKFEELIVPIPDSKVLTSSNGNLGIEYYGEVLSGEPDPAPGGMYMRALWSRRVGPDARAGKYKENAVFTQLSNGLNHNRLLSDWSVGVNTTSCNGFVGYVTTRLGLRGFTGFDFEKVLIKQGKGHCWVKPNGKERPNRGDLFETRSYNPGGYYNQHVGLHLSCESDDNWRTVEGGQGGSIAGADKIARVKKKWNTAHMRGWVDMRLLTSGRAAVPAWAIGGWVITIGSETFMYSISRYGKITERAYRPANGDLSASPIKDEAEIVQAVGNSIRLKWKSESGVEQLDFDPANSTGFMNMQLTGISARGVSIVGKKLVS